MKASWKTLLKQDVEIFSIVRCRDVKRLEVYDSSYRAVSIRREIRDFLADLGVYHIEVAIVSHHQFEQVAIVHSRGIKEHFGDGWVVKMPRSSASISITIVKDFIADFLDWAMNNLCHGFIIDETGIEIMESDDQDVFRLAYL